MSNYYPLAEVFGYQPGDRSREAERIRKNKYCPFHNVVAKCTKDKATDPLGVCSIQHRDHSVITCPIRFTEDLILFEPAANFFFPSEAEWTDVREVKLKDADGKAAGNIDYVLVSYYGAGKITDFGSLEVQGVYISGNIRDCFEEYMQTSNDSNHTTLEACSAKPDYLSSSRKRLAPQILFKGGILKSWNKRQAIALQKSFYETLPSLPQCDGKNADIIWLIFDLIEDQATKRLKLTLVQTVYTKFMDAMEANTARISIDDFQENLQRLLDELPGACY
jgi:hypothetical protein